MRQRYPERIVQPYRTAEVAAQAQAQHPYRLSVRFHPHLHFRLGAKSLVLLKIVNRFVCIIRVCPTHTQISLQLETCYSENAPQELNR